MRARIHVVALPLAGLALAGLLAACRAQRPPPPADQTDEAANADAATRPPFDHNPNMTGRARENSPDQPRLLWRFKTGDSVRSTPAVRDGMAYVGSYDGKVYAVRLRDGRKRWATPTGDGVESSPLLLEELLVVGSRDGKVYALDLRTGRPRWTFETGGVVMASPNLVTLDDGARLIVVGSYDGKLYALDAANGKQRWTCDTEHYLSGAAAVMTVDAQPHVVFGGCDGYVRLVDAASGKLVRKISLESYVPGTVVVDDNRLYAATFNNGLFALDLPKLETAWQTDWTRKQPGETTPARRRPPALSGSTDLDAAPADDPDPPEHEWMLSSPAVADQTLVIGTHKGNVYGIDARTGRRLWTHRSDGPVDGSPVIVCEPDGCRVIVGSDDGRLSVLDVDSGKVVGRIRIGQSITSTPAVVDGVILIGSDDGYLYAFEARP
ncbi:MAG: PQQ-binding-like beta-propeller repeat protein [Phycisphaerae bacterium]|nr:PQQ-binding-like beta-propeller repeat protein [Phycisphaerae bacterium]